MAPGAPERRARRRRLGVATVAIARRRWAALEWLLTTLSIGSYTAAVGVAASGPASTASAASGD
jgi:hypothetical protein